jgi:hypothetical protein
MRRKLVGPHLPHGGPTEISQQYIAACVITHHAEDWVNLTPKAIRSYP